MNASTRFSLGAAVAVLWLLTASTCPAQLGRLPLGSPDEVRDYYLSQVRQVLVYLAPTTEFEKGTNVPFYPFRCAPTTMDELVAGTRQGVVGIFKVMNGEGLTDPARATQRHGFLNARHDLPWTVIVTANAEAVFPALGSAGVAPILFESGPWFDARLATNHPFLLKQSGTNWLLPMDVVATIDFPVIAAGGRFDMYVRVPRGRRYKLDVDPGGPVQRIYERMGTGTFEVPSYEHRSPVPRVMAKFMAVADPRDMFLVRLPGPLLYQKLGWSLKVWLEDVQGNPLEQDFYPSGELRRTWHLKRDFFAHQ